MVLQLIDLGHEVDYIDIRPEIAPYSFSVRLDDKTYIFTIKYNDWGSFYTADLRTMQGEILAFGDPVRYGRALFNSTEDERFPMPVIIPQSVADNDVSEVTKDNFGVTVRLYLHERRVS